MTVVPTSRAAAARGATALLDRFTERLQELLPGGDLEVSWTLTRTGRRAATPALQSSTMHWHQTGTSLRFDPTVDLTPSLAKVQALQPHDLSSGTVAVYLAPHLIPRQRLRLEQRGWSYYDTAGNILIQSHQPLIAIRTIEPPREARRTKLLASISDTTDPTALDQSSR